MAVDVGEVAFVFEVDGGADASEYPSGVVAVAGVDGESVVGGDGDFWVVGVESADGVDALVGGGGGGLFA